MALYERRDSPFWWMLIERKGARSLRESTGIPVNGGRDAASKENEKLAQELYSRRMSEELQKRLKGISSARPRRGQQREQWTYIYFLRARDEIKIGRAIDVKKRLQSLQVGRPDRLEVLAIVPAHVGLERAIQRRFKPQQISGEWFMADEPLLGFIGRVQAGTHPVALLAAITD